MAGACASRPPHREESPILTAAKNANLALAFVLELAVYASVAVAAYQAVPGGRLPKLGAAAGGVIAMIVLWSVFGAPSASVTLHGAALVVFQAAWFAVGVVALLSAGRRWMGLALAVVTVLNLVLIFHWHQQKG